MQVHRPLLQDREQLLERLDDEDERDEHREALLREARDVADERAQVEHHDQHEDDEHPEADPEAQRQVGEVVVAANDR